MKNTEFKVNSKDVLGLALIWKSPELLILGFIGVGLTFITTLFFSLTRFFNAEVRRFEELHTSCYRKARVTTSMDTYAAWEYCDAVVDDLLK